MDSRMGGMDWGSGGRGETGEGPGDGGGGLAGESFQVGSCGYSCSRLAKGGLDHELPRHPRLVLGAPSHSWAEPQASKALRPLPSSDSVTAFLKPLSSGGCTTRLLPRPHTHSHSHTPPCALAPSLLRHFSKITVWHQAAPPPGGCLPGWPCRAVCRGVSRARSSSFPNCSH